MSLPRPPVDLLEPDDDGRLPPGTGLMIALVISMLCWAAIAAWMAFAG